MLVHCICVTAKRESGLEFSLQIKLEMNKINTCLGVVFCRSTKFLLDLSGIAIRPNGVVIVFVRVALKYSKILLRFL